MVETDTDKANIQYIKMEFFRAPTQNCRKLQSLNKEIDRTEQRIHVVHFVKGMRFFVDTLAHACFHMGSSESSGRGAFGTMAVGPFAPGTPLTKAEDREFESHPSPSLLLSPMNIPLDPMNSY